VTSNNGSVVTTKTMFLFPFEIAIVVAVSAGGFILSAVSVFSLVVQGLYMSVESAYPIFVCYVFWCIVMMCGHDCPCYFTM